MVVKTIVKPNAYYDSVTLMSISQKVLQIQGVTDAVVGMGTELNKDLIAGVGMADPKVREAGPNDLLIVVRAVDPAVLEQAVQFAEEALVQRKSAGKGSEVKPKSLEGALSVLPQANLAVISLPGAYAAREARKALEKNLHVMLFSDNVSLAEEIALKKMAHGKGLLLMGPDCGTAIINHIPLCFANAVRPGSIGIVAAAGTGAQEVTTLIDRFGGGVSQVIGTGGRDLKEEVGGIMMLDALQALEQDPATSVIVVISKPPAPAVAAKILETLKQGSKPAVVHFLGGDPQTIAKEGVIPGYNLEDTARKAVALGLGKELPAACGVVKVDCAVAQMENALFSREQKYVRALFTGGTLCEEAILTLGKELGTIHSNLALKAGPLLDDVSRSRGHTAIDFGDDKFTVGRPHPMIDPTIRLARILQEAHDPETAVILLDVVLGYGAHPDPAGVLAPVIREAKAVAKGHGRYLSIIAYVCGTDQDPQDYAKQSAALVQAGAVTAASNVKAAALAAAIVKDRQQA